jgi:hypothetical protein
LKTISDFEKIIIDIKYQGIVVPKFNIKKSSKLLGDFIQRQTKSLAVDESNKPKRGSKIVEFFRHMGLCK